MFFNNNKRQHDTLNFFDIQCIQKYNTMHIKISETVDALVLYNLWSLKNADSSKTEIKPLAVLWVWQKRRLQELNYFELDRPKSKYFDAKLSKWTEKTL